MAKEIITAKVKTDAVNEEGKAEYEEIQAEYDFGDNEAQAVELFGAEAVHSGFVANSRVWAQGLMRSWRLKGMTPEDVQMKLGAAKPGVQTGRVTIDPRTAYANYFRGLSPEQQKEELSKLGY